MAASFSPQQREIVRLEARLRRADAIKKRVSAATARAEKLAQPILAKAFRSELVSRRNTRAAKAASTSLRRCCWNSSGRDQTKTQQRHVDPKVADIGFECQG
jgi:hypothetical protein